MEKGKVILWIPTLQYLGQERSSALLQQAFDEVGILYKQLFCSIDISPQGFPLGRDIVLDIDSALGFSFDKLVFSENEQYKGFYNLTQNTLTVGLKLSRVGDYLPTELAQYFKKYWIAHPSD